jgi:hypothetical protein
MELGTGIFLSSLVLSIVLLYGFTKDRVRWGRFFKYAGIALAVLIIPIFSTFWILEAWRQRRQPLAEISGISLGDRDQDLLFRIGEPEYTCRSTDGKNVKRIFRQDESGRALFVISDADKIVQRLQIKGDRFDRAKNARVTEWDDETSLIEKWGTPDEMFTSGDFLRHYVYKRYNLIIELFKNRVQSVTIFNSAGEFYQETDFKFEPCMDNNGKADHLWGGFEIFSLGTKPGSAQ